VLRSVGSPYDVIFSVHDELVAEVDEDKGSVKDFEALMSHTEDWAAGCPIVAEGNRFKRYRK
jgi:DNA polymerase